MEDILHQLILVGSLSVYPINCFQSFIHPRLCRISSINSVMTMDWDRLALGTNTMTTGLVIIGYIYIYKL